MSHLACAAQPDHPMNGRQLDRFREARALFPAARASLASSGGIFLGRDYAFDQVRPGISLFGGGPHDRPDPRIAAVATLEAPILQVRSVPAGETIGYGAAFTAETDLRVAVIAAGYADGIPRASHPGGEVWFAGARRRMVGRISMDMTAIDVTGCAEARPGAMVEILGNNLPVDDAAKAADATTYELLTRLSTRAERRWLGAV
jgi:alanine racemase